MNNEIETFDEIMAINAETITLADMINIMFRTDFISRESEIFPQEMVHPSIHDEQSLQQLNDTIRYNKERKRWIIIIQTIMDMAEIQQIETFEIIIYGFYKLCRSHLCGGLMVYKRQTK